MLPRRCAGRRWSLLAAASLSAFLAVACDDRSTQDDEAASVSASSAVTKGVGGTEAPAGVDAGAESSAEPASAELLVEADSAIAGVSDEASSLELVSEVPLREGLTVVTAIAEERGDYESIKTVTELSAGGVHIVYSAEAPDLSGELQRVRSQRTLRLEDLRVGRAYRVVFHPKDPEVMPGTTALGISTAVLKELRAAERTIVRVIGTPDMTSAVFAMLTGTPEFAGEIERVDPEMVRVPVVLNGRRVALPAIRARGELSDGIQTFDSEFHFLDDAANPLALRFSIGPTSLRVVRIDVPPQGTTVSDLERALVEQGHVEVYGIYFSFNSAEIRPESEPVLDEVAGILRRHPDWRLRIEGHTDAVGTAAANLELSRRRAGAVKQALVQRLSGGGERLDARGLGETRPRESNATLEGRARNRRVELVKFQ